MPELQKNYRRSYAAFDAMSTEALEEILRADAQQLDDERNLDAVLYITELLEKRTAAEGGDTFDPKEHMPDFSALLNNAEKTTSTSVVKTKNGRKILRTMLVAAATCVMIFALAGIAVAAFGVNIWNAIGSWTDEVFRFQAEEGNVESETEASAPIPPTDLLADNLQQALSSCGITEFGAPTYLPEGYELDELIVDTRSGHRFIYVSYANADGVLISFCADEFAGKPGLLHLRCTHRKRTQDRC